MAYIIRVIVMFLVTWTGIRLIGRKSLSEMTAYDLTALLLMTSIASEPLVYKITSKSIIGVTVLIILTSIVGNLSLTKFFYKIDSKPTIIIIDGKIMERDLRKAEISIPLLLSELRVNGYNDVSDIKYAYLEPSGKISVIPKSEVSPITPEIMGIKAPPIHLTFPLIINGEIEETNLNFLQKDKQWLLNQLKNKKLNSVEDILLAQYNTSGKLVVNLKNEEIELPEII